MLFRTSSRHPRRARVRIISPRAADVIGVAQSLRSLAYVRLVLAKVTFECVVGTAIHGNPSTRVTQRLLNDPSLGQCVMLKSAP